MDLGMREWMLIGGAALVFLVLCDGVRRVIQERRSSLYMRSNKGDPIDDYISELPNGGARIIERADILSDIDVSSSLSGAMNATVDQAVKKCSEDILSLSDIGEGVSVDCCEKKAVKKERDDIVSNQYKEGRLNAHNKLDEGSDISTDCESVTLPKNSRRISSESMASKESNNKRDIMDNTQKIVESGTCSDEPVSMSSSGTGGDKSDTNSGVLDKEVVYRENPFSVSMNHTDGLDKLTAIDPLFVEDEMSLDPGFISGKAMPSQVGGPSEDVDVNTQAVTEAGLSRCSEVSVNDSRMYQVKSQSVGGTSGQIDVKMPLSNTQGDRVKVGKKLFGRLASTLEDIPVFGKVESVKKTLSNQMVSEVFEEAALMSQPDEAPSIKKNQHVEIINVLSKSVGGFDAQKLHEFFTACDIQLSKSKVYVRYEKPKGQGAVQFNIANLTASGVFAPDVDGSIKISGLCFYLTIPGPSDPMVAFEAMYQAAEYLAKHMGGVMKDRVGSDINRQVLAYYRADIREYCRKHLTETV